MTTHQPSAAEQAAQDMVAMAMEDRPFTPEEREQIMFHMSAVTRFIKQHEKLMGWTMAGSLAIAFLCGVVFGKVLL